MKYGSADRYYINPYEIAVQRGFRGSVDEWLASLKGEKGDTGHGLEVLGLYDTLGSLQQAVPTPEAGNCYAVGDADENTIYCWNGTAWQDIGPIKGDQGETGPTGPQGMQGPEGKAATIAVKTTATGEPGTAAQVVNEGTANAAQLVFTIPRGATGETGPTGPQGAKGDKGNKGDQGDIGPQGPKGETGPQGATGPQGPKGDKGDQGDKGDTGDNGATFTPTVSADGVISWTNDKSLPNPAAVNIKGPQGAKGDKGDTGAQGPQGDQGATGPQGPQGATGPQGPKGDKGDTGSGFLVLDYYATLEDLQEAVPTPAVGDAYGIGSGEPYDIYIYGETSGWVNNGPLQGAKGDKGDKGDTGSQGPQGEPGQQGPIGPAGADGEDGGYYTPTVDGSGNLTWAGSKSGMPVVSGANIKGPQGPAGEDGATGADGAPGADGEDGATFTPTVSAEGIISWTNDKSLPNPTAVNIKGPQGAKGDQGDTGPQGPQGETGPQGPQGPAGADGAPGEQGPAGPNEVSASTDSSITGLLKGASGKVAQAVAGEDYALPQKEVSVTLLASGWIGEGPYNQTITVAGVTADNAVFPVPSPDSWSEAGEAAVYCSAQVANSLTFSASQKPTSDLSYNVLIQEVRHG